MRGVSRHPLANACVTSGRVGCAVGRLISPGSGEPFRAGMGGSLNTYGVEPDAFSDEAQEIGLILAAHASMAAGAVRERGALQDLAQNLDKALLSRDVIGQAKGILMERLKIGPEDAFDVLRRSSNRLNQKLHAVALRVAETGEFDTSGRSTTRPG